ncbi:MAG: bifunctional folylpolyglutamate synthase/dihydrofolate synthase [Candidatus Scalindua sp.]|jgi:dihydrofolate synthase/folylpolyglutamate synthase|nr:bifunctional folylpolyglutamate synthase/dihydrofolate synthase [Candidatus Scalindua sp.]MBT5303779.1 bifunctional folylpolyglutamate synthase/dihydrofolate synthase [Candidatus Scalindua sp.]MBT6562671.1 bifunctional folylpolyglutamate synthase/dihydrofolate synthase [Candidatus Scalindua sp.]MBT7210233.1 bifunctional folylpolyglutamate synthase/dihydrofolate synthase [Candidatus Scalindua sp.]MBT7592553.1 bifunctional folylpolyglutamate synthase/dihydrofolate synthase [Candidatus Scalindu
MKSKFFNSYKQAKEFLLQTIDYEKLTQYKYDTSTFDLKRMEEMMSFVGNPHKKESTVHITGTKGKGSTSIIISSALQALGLKTGLFTSPHLIYLGERMKVNDKMISQKMFVELINMLKPYIDRITLKNPILMPTFFEIVTAITFLYFEREKTDISVLEVGLGGRLDSTNIILPEVSVITPVGYDHTDRLGHTLEKIAYEKAGIIKEGIPVISSIQESDALAVISKTCKEKNSHLYLVGRDILIHNLKVTKRNGVYGTECEIKTWRNNYNNIFLPLVGRHQVENCAAAIGALEVLSEAGAIKTNNELIINVLANIRCPARIEVISENPLIIVDTAHTVASMKILRESIQENFSFRKLVLVIGLSEDKDIEGVLKEITCIADDLILTRTGNPREAEPEQMAVMAKPFYHKDPLVIEDIDEALKEAKRITKKDDLICITGSFFLAGKVKEILNLT